MHLDRKLTCMGVAGFWIVCLLEACAATLKGHLENRAYYCHQCGKCIVKYLYGYWKFHF